MCLGALEPLQSTCGYALAPDGVSTVTLRDRGSPLGEGLPAFPFGLRATLPALLKNFVGVERESAIQVVQAFGPGSRAINVASICHCGESPRITDIKRAAQPIARSLAA